MSDLLSIGGSGLRAYARALATASDNIANANTPGYARRTLRLEEGPAGGDSYHFRANVRPGGVRVGGVERAYDAWLADDARTAGGDASRAGIRSGWIEAVERAMDDGQSGVGQSMTAIFNAADRLSADPGNVTLRAQFLGAVESTAAAFRRTGAGLSGVATGIVTEATTEVAALNTDLEALTHVNDGLRRARPGSSNEAGLLDERDRLVNSITDRIGGVVTYDDRGAASIGLTNPSGDMLVSGSTAAQVSLSLSGGVLAYTLNPGSTATFAPVTGSLAGLADASSQVAGQRVALDVLAAQFASQLNAVHQSGLDANGNPGGALLDANGGAAAMVALALTPATVAAANGSSENGNITAMSSLRGPGGGESSWAALVAAQAQATAAARAQADAATVRRDGAFAARDMLSEVDLDTEAAELLRFQQAYDAAARVVQVARETMQSILNVF